MQQSVIQRTTSDEELARLIVERAYERERARRRAALPRWVPWSLRVLPWVLGVVTVANGLLGVLAVVAPLLRRALGDAWTDWIYTAFSFTCPQRPSHTWWLAGEPMAVEQRDVAMYLAFGVAGALYLRWRRLRQPLPTWGLALGLAPMAIDVALSSAGIQPSTPLSRLWTGSLSAVVIVWWVYPRFDTMLRAAQLRVGDAPAASIQSGPPSLVEPAGWPGISED